MGTNPNPRDRPEWRYPALGRGEHATTGSPSSRFTAPKQPTRSPHAACSCLRPDPLCTAFLSRPSPCSPRRPLSVAIRLHHGRTCRARVRVHQPFTILQSSYPQAALPPSVLRRGRRRLQLVANMEISTCRSTTSQASLQSTATAPTSPRLHLCQTHTTT